MVGGFPLKIASRDQTKATAICFLYSLALSPTAVAVMFNNGGWWWSFPHLASIATTDRMLNEQPLSSLDNYLSQMAVTWGGIIIPNEAVKDMGTQEKMIPLC